MKKIIILISFIGFALMAYSQVSVDVYMRTNQTYGHYTGVATDTINGVATADAIFYVGLAEKARYTLSWMLDGDTLAGSSGDCTIQPQGSYDGVTYSNIGSSTAWSSDDAVYAANVNANTYTEVTASFTETKAAGDIPIVGTQVIAAYDITTTDSLLYDDTLSVAQQTRTVTLPGCDWRYIKILVTGASGARVEVDAVAIKVTPIDVPL